METIQQTYHMVCLFNPAHDQMRNLHLLSGCVAEEIRRTPVMIRKMTSMGLNLLSGSPATHILPGPVGDFLLSRSALSNFDTFSLKIGRGHKASMSIAKKKCPSGIGLGSPVARSIPQISSPNTPDWKAVQRSSTVVAQPKPL